MVDGGNGLYVGMELWNSGSANETTETGLIGWGLCNEAVRQPAWKTDRQNYVKGEVEEFGIYLVVELS